MAAEHEQVEVTGRAALRRWLKAHHGQAESIWLVTYKKGSPHYLPYEEIVEEALIWGWIDSQPRTLDEERSMRRLSPRQAKSGWSGVNKAKAEALIAEGRMMPSGMAAVEAARANGAWEAIDHAVALVVPDDLRAELARYRSATANFDGFPPSTRRAILEWIGNAKQPATRSKRIAETARLADQNIRANQWRP